jgi:hypothetical protein
MVEVTNKRKTGSRLNEGQTDRFRRIATRRSPSPMLTPDVLRNADKANTKSPAVPIRSTVRPLLRGAVR